jgi:hypothetical protein
VVDTRHDQVVKSLVGDNRKLFSTGEVLIPASINPLQVIFPEYDGQDPNERLANWQKARDAGD